MELNLSNMSLNNGGGGGGGSTVSWNQTLSAGTQIAQITIDGTTQNVYAPTAETAEQDYVVASGTPQMTSKEGRVLYVQSNESQETKTYFTADMNNYEGDYGTWIFSIGPMTKTVETWWMDPSVEFDWRTQDDWDYYEKEEGGTYYLIPKFVYTAFNGCGEGLANCETGSSTTSVTFYQASQTYISKGGAHATHQWLQKDVVLDWLSNEDLMRLNEYLMKDTKTVFGSNHPHNWENINVYKILDSEIVKLSFATDHLDGDNAYFHANTIENNIPKAWTIYIYYSEDESKWRVGADETHKSDTALEYDLSSGDIFSEKPEVVNAIRGNNNPNIPLYAKGDLRYTWWGSIEPGFYSLSCEDIEEGNTIGVSISIEDQGGGVYHYTVNELEADQGVDFYNDGTWNYSSDNRFLMRAGDGDDSNFEIIVLVDSFANPDGFLIESDDPESYDVQDQGFKWVECDELGSDYIEMFGAIESAIVSPEDSPRLEFIARVQIFEDGEVKWYRVKYKSERGVNQIDIVGKQELNDTWE